MPSHFSLSDSLQPHGLPACQPPRSMGFSRQECWSELPCPPPGDPPNSDVSYIYLHWQAGSLPLAPLGKLNPGVRTQEVLA